jgi:hypothetical protein
MPGEEFPQHAPFNLLDVDISQDADWNDPFQIIEANDDPLDLTGLVLELYIRPKFGHDTLLKKLSTVGSAGIIVDNPVEGMAYFFLDRAVVLADLPVGEWQQFLVLTEGSLQTEIWRGQIRIHPGLIAA